MLGFGADGAFKRCVGSIDSLPFGAGRRRSTVLLRCRNRRLRNSDESRLRGGSGSGRGGSLAAPGLRIRHQCPQSVRPRGAARGDIVHHVHATKRQADRRGQEVAGDAGGRLDLASDRFELAVRSAGSRPGSPGATRLAWQLHDDRGVKQRFPRATSDR